MGKDKDGKEGDELPPFGSFTLHSSIHIGDPYVKKAAPDSRYRGRQLLSSIPKRGQTSDNWNVGKFHYDRLFEGEVYEDPGAAERAFEASHKKKNLTPVGFIPTSPPKRMSGLGSQYGSFGPSIEHMADEVLTKKKPQPHLKQIIISPAKKGSFGYVGTTLSKPAPYDSEPYGLKKELEKEELKKSMKQRLDGPFKPPTRPNEFFDTHPNVAVSKIYTADKELPPIEPKHEYVPITQPFIPSHLPHTGYNATFSPFPEYKGAPYDEQTIHNRELAKLSRKKVPTAWRPPSIPKNPPQPSVSAMNVVLSSSSMRKAAFS